MNNTYEALIAKLERTVDKPSVAIGSRWQPTHLLIRNPDTGVYIERNPPIWQSPDALRLQSALLLKPKQGWWK